MFVQQISPSIKFRANIKQTKQGNFYTETNAGKTAGTIFGLSGAILLGCSDIVQTGSKDLASRLFKKHSNYNTIGWASAGIILAGATLLTAIGRKWGAVMDNVVNTERYEKADRVY